MRVDKTGVAPENPRVPDGEAIVAQAMADELERIRERLEKRANEDKEESEKSSAEKKAKDEL